MIDYKDKKPRDYSEAIVRSFEPFAEGIKTIPGMPSRYGYNPRFEFDYDSIECLLEHRKLISELPILTPITIGLNGQIEIEIGGEDHYYNEYEENDSLEIVDSINNLTHQFATLISKSTSPKRFNILLSGTVIANIGSPIVYRAFRKSFINFGTGSVAITKVITNQF
jgi:hypothetical protein